MAVSEAQKKAVAKYNAKAYDRLEMKVPKGEKEGIIAHAEKTDGTLNKFLNRAVREAMERDNGTVVSENTPINKQPVISDDIIQTRAKEDRAVQTAPPKARARREISDSQLMEIANRLKNEKQDNTIKPLDNS